MVPYHHPSGRASEPGLHPDRTFFRRNTAHYQLHHIFGDRETEQQVVSWSVMAAVAADLGLSDHAPVIVDIDDSSF